MLTLHLSSPSAALAALVFTGLESHGWQVLTMIGGTVKVSGTDAARLFADARRYDSLCSIA